MGQLENMQLFIKVVELGSITRTADNLDMAKSAVSRRMTELERDLGVKLIQRTTRSSHLTEAGKTYYRKSKLLVSEVEELHAELNCQQQSLSGTLKLAVPLSFGLSHLMPALDVFLKAHPDLKLDVHFSDSRVDIVEQGFDLAFRIGQLQDSSLRSRAITPIKQLLCASPEYLAKYGEPKNIEQLKTHNLLKYSGLSVTGLPIEDPNGKTYMLSLNSNCSANNGDFLKSMAVAGHGIIMGPTFIAWKEFQSGKLVPIMTDHKFEHIQAFAVFPETRFMPAKVRVFIDFLVARFGDEPYWDLDLNLGD